MSIKLQLTFLILLLSFTSLFGESFSCLLKDKGEEVTVEQLKEETYAKDENAKAVILDEQVKVRYVYNQNEGFTVQTQFYRKIKIYHKDALWWGTHLVNLTVSNSSKEKLINIKGKTYNLVNDKIQIEKLSKSSVFEEEVSKSKNSVKLTLPKVKEGSIIEYSYTKISPFFGYIDPIFFEKEIPVVKMDVDIRIPEYFNYNIQTRGEYPINLARSVERGSLQYTEKHRSNNQSFSVTRTSFETTNIDFTSKIYKVMLTDVPALTKEPFVPNVWNYASTLEFYLQTIKYPYGKLYNYAQTWNDVLKKLKDRPVYRDEISKSEYYKEDLAAITSKVSDEKLKINMIYDHVKKTVKWNNYRTSLPYQGVKKAYKNGVGSSGQINAILLSMLQKANIKARPVFVISDQGRNSIFPNYNAFDYLIVEVVTKSNSKIYLDATDQKSAPNVLPNRVVQGVGKLLSDSNVAVDVDLRVKPSKEQGILTYSIDESGVVTGKYKLQREKNAALNRRYFIKDTKEENEEEVKKYYELAEISNYKNTSVNELRKALSESFDFKIDNQSTVVDDEIYFYPMLSLKKVTNPLKQEHRKFPIDWGFPKLKASMILITIPEEYKIVSVPEQTSFALPNDGGIYSFQTRISGNTISIRVKEKLNKAFFSIGEESESLKAFYKMLVEKENEQIVLKKI